MLDRPWPDDEQVAFEAALAELPPAPSLSALDDWPDPREDPGFEEGDITPESIALAGRGYPEPEDRGDAVLSPLGDIEYVTDLIRPGRIHTIAAEEDTGKTYGMTELAVRVATAGGSFAGTWTVEATGPVVYLSEMHPDDDYAYEQTVLDSLGVDRDALQGCYYRLDLNTAAHGQPVLMDRQWRSWFMEWTRRRGTRLAIFDTATGATQVDPWGRDIQSVFRDLRAMLFENPELAIVLVIHMKKPSGRGARRISDLLGEWGRWCDVVVMMESEGADRTKVSTHKRIRHQRRIVVTRSGGLLIDPVDITDAKPVHKVSSDKVVATVKANEGLPYAELAKELGVTKPTVIGYVKAMTDRLSTLPDGPRGQVRVFTISESDRQPSNDRKASTFDGALTDDSAGKGPVTVNRQAPHPLKGGADLTVAGSPPTDDLTTEAEAIFGGLR